MNIYKELGLQEISKNPDKLAALKQHVSIEASKIIPGFYYNYTLYTFPDNLEFEYCKTPEGEEAGFDIHYSGNNICDFTFEKELVSGTAPIYLMASRISEELLPVRVVCPDTRPPARTGYIYHGQIVAFAATDSFQTIDADGYSVKQTNAVDTVRVIGKVNSVTERSFEFDSIHADYYDVDIETSIGSVSVLVAGIEKIPEEGQFIQADCILSLDVAIKPTTYIEGPFYEDPYKDILPPSGEDTYYVLGFIPNARNDVQVICDAIERKDFSRITRSCAKEISLSDTDGNRIIDRNSLGEYLKGITPAGELTLYLSHCISNNNSNLMGLQGIEIKETDTPLIDLLFQIDDNGQVDRVYVCSPDNCQMGIDYELHALVQLKEAMCNGNLEALTDILSENCTYKSEYGGRTVVGAVKIMQFLGEIQGNLNDETQYTGEIISSKEVLRDCEKRPDAYSGSWCLIEHQSGEIAAAIFIRINSEQRITNILLSRNGRFVNLFEKRNAPVDNGDTRSVKVMLSEFFGDEDPINGLRGNPAPDDNHDIYIWKNADEYARSWLNNSGYSLEDTIPEDDSIAYPCSYKDEKWTLYLFAFGERKQVDLDTEYCVQLKNRKTAEDRKVIIIGVQVKISVDEQGKTQHKIHGYDRENPESWIISNVKGKDIVLFYPRRDVFEMVPRLMAAANMRDRDLLDALFAKDGYLEDLNGGRFLNNAYFTSLVHHVIEHGKMKTAYVSYDGTIYSKVPYLEDYCYLTFSVSDQHKIEHITEKALDCSYVDLLITDEVLLHDPRNDTPRLVAVETFAPSDFSRLSLRLTYENNDIRRYDFKGDFGKEKVFSLEGYTFTDKMFSHPRLTDHHAPVITLGSSYFAEQGQGVEFVNGYSIAAVPMYFDSYPIEQFSYAGMDNVHVSQFDYDEDGFGLGHISDLDPRNPLYLLDRNTMTARTLPEEFWDTPIFIEPFCGGYSEGRIMVSTLRDLDLQYHHELHGSAGMWGWLDKDFNEVIPPQYPYALNFVDGQAIVCKGEWDIKEENGKKSYWCEHEAWGVIDKDGKEIIPCAYDELHDIDGTSRLYLVHEGGWDDGHNAIYDIEEHDVILELDFEFDRGYMFNECFVTDKNILVFMDHQAGEGLDYLYAYDLIEKKFLAYKEEYRERTYNGKSRVVVKKDGEDIIVF